MSVLLSIGHGYSAQALARRLLPKGWRIIGTTRSAEKAAALRTTGVEAIVWPLADLRPALLQATHLLSSVAPNEAGDPVLGELHEAIADTQLDWAAYLSTTGVYGHHDGDWVDESAPLNPGTERGARRVKAEAEWQAISNLPLHIFRLAGIYGPGRGPFEKVRNGTARRIVKPGQFFSRIHVEDIAAVLEASIAQPNPGAIYNVCDDEPAPPEDILSYAAQLLDMPAPPEIPYDTADMTPAARGFYKESKRVSNSRLKRDLGIELSYPNYRIGLAAILAAEKD